MQRWLAVSVAAIAFLSVEAVGAQAVDAAPKGAVSEVSQSGAQGDAGAGSAMGAVGAESSAVVVEKDDPMREATLEIVEAIGETGFGAWLREHQAAWNAIAIGVLFVIGIAIALLVRRVLDTLKQFDAKADVALFSPEWDQLAYFQSPFEQGDA
jgi:hypothetical protein